ncbi:MAG TPA: PAS domain-containing protein [Coriobacteriia bacterium]|jgi:PAS domain-containing protein
MSANVLNVIANLISALAFTAAFVGVLAIPDRPGGFVRAGMKLLFAGAMSVYMFVGFSHVLQFLNVTTALDIFENYLKVLFIPLLACAAYALSMNEQLRIMQRQAGVLSAEHDMLMRIVDTTPTGVVVLDVSGRIEFANDRAREMLELEDDPDTSRILTPRWTCGDSPGSAPGDLSACLTTSQVRDEARTLRWPDGTTRSLSLNATPIFASDGSRVGAVVAFTSADPGSAAATAI